MAIALRRQPGTYCCSQRRINVCSSGCLKTERDLTSSAPKIVPISLTRTPSPQLPSPATSKSSEDVEMKDAYAPNSSPRYSPTFGRRSLDSPSIVTNTAAGVASTLLPSQAAHSFTHLHPPNGQRLQLSTLPPVPSFPSAITSANPAPTPSPVVKTPSGAQPTFSFPAASNSCAGLSASTVAPSPVKKKLSLGDYMSRISNLATTPTVEKTHSQVLEPNSPAAPSQDPLRKISPLAEERHGSIFGHGETK